MLCVVLMVMVVQIVVYFVQSAGEEGVHFGRGKGLVARVGGDAEGLAEEHGLWAERAVSSRPVLGWEWSHVLDPPTKAPSQSPSFAN